MSKINIEKIKQLIDLKINSRDVLDNSTSIFRFKDDCLDYQLLLSGDKESLTHKFRNRVLNNKWEYINGDITDVSNIEEWFVSQVGSDVAFFDAFNIFIDDQFPIESSDESEEVEIPETLLDINVALSLSKSILRYYLSR